MLSQPVSPNGNGVGPGSQTPREAPESSRASVSNGSDGGGSSFRSKGSSQKSSTNGTCLFLIQAEELLNLKS